MNLTDFRTLGRTGLRVSPLTLGTMTFGDSGWGAGPATSREILARYVDAGGNVIDTANRYMDGASETVIGEWLRTSGKQMGVATKVGMLPGEGGEKLTPARIAAACDASLKRLGIEQIALYYAHQDDDATPQEAYMEAFATLVAAGVRRGA